MQYGRTVLGVASHRRCHRTGQSKLDSLAGKARPAAAKNPFPRLRAGEFVVRLEIRRRPARRPQPRKIHSADRRENVAACKPPAYGTGIAIIVIFISMHHYIFSRLTKPCLAAVIAFVWLLPAAPLAHANVTEPTEFYATASDGTPLHWVVYTPARRWTMAGDPRHSRRRFQRRGSHEFGRIGHLWTRLRCGRLHRVLDRISARSEWVSRGSGIGRSLSRSIRRRETGRPRRSRRSSLQRPGWFSRRFGWRIRDRLRCRHRDSWAGPDRRRSQPLRRL